MKKISKGAPKKWTSTPGSYGDSFLIEGGSGSRDNAPYDKYIGYVVDENQKAKEAFKAAPYGKRSIKCPKCGSDRNKVTKKGSVDSYTCADCKNIWEKKRIS